MDLPLAVLLKCLPQVVSQRVLEFEAPGGEGADHLQEVGLDHAGGLELPGGGVQDEGAEEGGVGAVGGGGEPDGGWWRVVGERGGGGDDGGGVG